MKAPPLVSRFPRYAEFSRWVRTTATFVASERYLFFEATLIQFIVRILDGLTLYLIVLSIGGSAPYAVCFFAVALASVAATVAPSPMGLGAFEAGMIATLTLFGVTIEDALTATLVFRGLSLWLPLAPGLYIIQREILKRNAA